jgi:hypothetical protein
MASARSQVETPTDSSASRRVKSQFLRVANHSLPRRNIAIIAEFSIHPIGSGTGVGSYVKAAVDSDRAIPVF